MKKCLILFALILMATPVFAQGDDDMPPPPPPGMNGDNVAPSPKNENFKKRRQRPSREEMEKKRAEFIKKYDKDGDGQISETEQVALREEMMKNRPHRDSAFRGGRMGPPPGADSMRRGRPDRPRLDSSSRQSFEKRREAMRARMKTKAKQDAKTEASE